MMLLTAIMINEARSDMYYRNEVQGYFKNNRILALKFDRALSSVRVGVSNQIEMIGFRS